MRRQLCVTLVAAVLLSAGAVLAQVTPADYARSEGLRDAWMYLTRNVVADPPQWIGAGGKFVYRKTVSGGFSFVVMDAKTGEKRPAFDQEKLAAALNKSLGSKYSALRLPFAEVDLNADETMVSFGDQEIGRWRCRLADYTCMPVAAGSHGRSAWCATYRFRPTIRPNDLPTASGRRTSTISTS